ncbi:MAG: ATP-binding protein [Kiritimatiellae bacterium]|nr:ATP-binding protein [Kiritimatiellia bacterium]
MKYIVRRIEPCVRRMLELFPAVVLTGPRRTGKTFMLRNMLPDAQYVMLEDPDVLLSVKADPRGFLDELSFPVVIDEIQQAPELFNYIRSRIDSSPGEKGRWILTGSQEVLLMRSVGESMAGRAGILRLSPFAQTECTKVTPFSGGYPEALAAGRNASLWYSSYVQTYLERDVRSVIAVKNLMTFHRFLRVLATRHGQMMNKTDIAAPLGVSVPTITEWMNVLEMSGLIVKVAPFYRNAGKRLVKTPKVYFLDSGLLCHLLGIRSDKELSLSPFAGVIFEGFVISEIIKAQHALGNEGEVYYFRDEQGLEVDIVLSPQAGRVVLAECKLSSTISPSMSASMRRLALALDKEKCRIDMRLIHTPSPTGRITSTAGEGVRACSTNEFIAEMFG